MVTYRRRTKQSDLGNTEPETDLENKDTDGRAQQRTQENT